MMLTDMEADARTKLDEAQRRLGCGPEDDYLPETLGVILGFVLINALDVVLSAILKVDTVVWWWLP